MHFEVYKENGKTIAVAKGEGILLKDVNTALDLIANANHLHEAEGLVLYKENIIESFFDLSTRIAGEILQKFTNYSMRLAIVGDFSSYKSKSLHDFIYECNNGKTVYFLSTLEEALQRLQA